MIPQNIAIFDGFLNLLGAIGIWPALHRLYREDNQNPIEAILKWILSFLFVLWCVRFVYHVFALDSLGGLVYTIAICFGFCFCLFTEILLRRHFPIWFKFYLTLGCLFFIGTALTGHLSDQRANLIPFGIYILSLQAIILALTIFRRSADYSRTENSIIGTSMVFLLLIAPLFLSDELSYQIKDLPRLGVCGGLIFAYISIYNQALFFQRGILVKKLLKSIVTAAALTLATHFLIDSLDALVLGRLFVLFFSLHLLFRIHFAIYYLNGEDEMHHFVSHVNQSPKRSILEFLQEMSEYYAQFEAVLLQPSDLAGSNAQDIKKFFENLKIATVSRYEVGEWRNNKDYRWSSSELEAIEKIRDILETHEKSHFCKLGFQTSYFVLFNCPFISYQKIIESQTEFLTQIVALIEDKES